jgi:hypothetical protein
VSIAEEQCRLWVEEVLGIPVILEDQDDPSAPRRLKEAAVTNYAAISLDTDGSTQSTPYEHTSNEEIQTTASEAVPGGTTPASALPVVSTFGFLVGSKAKIITAGGDEVLEIEDVTESPPIIVFAAGAIDFDIAENDLVIALGTVTRTRSEVVQGTLAVEIYGNGVAAVELARKLRLARGGNAYRERFADQEITIITQGQIVDEPVLRSATREPKAALLFGVRWTEYDLEPIPAAASFEAETTVTGGTP